MGHATIESISIVSRNGAVKEVLKKGTVGVGAGDRMGLSAADNVVTLTSMLSPDSPRSPGPYDELYRDITERRNAFAGFNPWLSSVAGVSTRDGGFSVAGDACVHVGTVPDPNPLTHKYGDPVVQSNPLQVRDTCPPCVDCKDYERRDDQGREGLFDLIRRVNDFIDEEAAKIIGAGLLLDRFTEVEAAWNYVAHARCLKFEAGTVGGKTWFTIKYANLTDRPQGFSMDVDFTGTAPLSRAYYIDSSVEGFDKGQITWRDNRDDSNYGPSRRPESPDPLLDTGWRPTMPRVFISVSGIPVQGKFTAHGAMWQPRNTMESDPPSVTLTTSSMQGGDVTKTIRTNESKSVAPWLYIRTGEKP